MNRVDNLIVNRSVEVVAYCYKIVWLVVSTVNGIYACQCVKCPLGVACRKKNKNIPCVKKNRT